MNRMIILLGAVFLIFIGVCRQFRVTNVRKSSFAVW